MSSRSSNFRHIQSCYRAVNSVNFEQLSFPQKTVRGNNDSSLCPDKWHNPDLYPEGEITILTNHPRPGFINPISPQEVRTYLTDLAPRLPEPLEEKIRVIEFCANTRHQANRNLFGLQWGQGVYLFPYVESLSELYLGRPHSRTVNETTRYGGKWKGLNDGSYVLEWKLEQLKDFYLYEVLTHEIGHAFDDRNRTYKKRESFADHFANQYGYSLYREQRGPRRVIKNHHNLS